MPLIPAIRLLSASFKILLPSDDSGLKDRDISVPVLWENKRRKIPPCELEFGSSVAAHSILTVEEAKKWQLVTLAFSGLYTNIKTFLALDPVRSCTSYLTVDEPLVSVAVSIWTGNKVLHKKMNCGGQTIGIPESR